jgi:hypothetical protein
MPISVARSRPACRAMVRAFRIPRRASRPPVGGERAHRRSPLPRPWAPAARSQIVKPLAPEVVLAVDMNPALRLIGFPKGDRRRPPGSRADVISLANRRRGQILGRLRDPAGCGRCHLVEATRVRGSCRSRCGRTRPSLRRITPTSGTLSDVKAARQAPLLDIASEETNIP